MPGWWRVSKPPVGTPKIEGFLKGVRPNRWLQADKMEVYVRKAVHVVQGMKASSCFDIANIQVHPDFQNQGVFSSWLAYVEEALRGNEQFELIFVESILNPHLIQMLGRRGYRQQSDPIMPNMYKEVAR